MQIIISPVAGGDNFPLDVPQEERVVALRTTLATRLNVPSSSIKVGFSFPLQPSKFLDVPLPQFVLRPLFR